MSSWGKARPIASTTLTLLVLITMAGGCSSKADAADPATHLSCSDEKVVSASVDHDDTTKEARSPQEQATAWAQAQGNIWAGAQKVVYKSDDRTDITFSDGQGNVTGVLSYHKDENLGWRLQTAQSCA